MKPCLLWTKSGTDGYGRRRINGKLEYAHRTAYKEVFGDIPDGLIVTHSCDVRACIEPSHLKLGTQQSNARERVRRGRQGDITGEKNGRAALTTPSVKRIRKEYAKGGKTHRGLAKENRVSLGCITAILSRRSWKHI